MKVLLVEDDDDKAQDVAEFLRSKYLVTQIDVVRSLQSGLRAVLSEAHDLILLDMTMRNFDRTLEEEGGRPHHFAGREILRQMKREDVRTPVIIVTHFERFGEEDEEITLTELKEDLSRRFTDYLGTVHYRSNVDEWKQQLAELIQSRLQDRQS